MRDYCDEQAARPAALRGERVYGCGPDNVPGGRDTVGHSSVQAWSAGDFFPATIAIIERYVDRGASVNRSTLAMRLQSTCAELTLDGVSRRYATYDDAAMVARALVRDATMRAAWRDTSED